MDKIYDGKKLSSCLNLASAAGKEIESLSQLLNNVLINHLKENKIRNDNKFSVHYQSDDSGWIYTDVAHSIGILEHKKKKVSKYLGYQISLLGDGMVSAGEPLAHFFYWDSPVDFDNVWIGFPFDKDWGKYTVENDHLILWEDEKQPEWMFSVRLMTINDENDVNRIVQSMIDLLVTETLKMPSELPGLVSYYLEESELKISACSITSSL